MTLTCGANPDDLMLSAAQPHARPIEHDVESHMLCSQTGVLCLRNPRKAKVQTVAYDF